MAFCRLASVLLVLSVVQCFASVQVPVFLWGDLAKASLKSSPLAKLEPQEFGLVLKHELQNDVFTVIFIEETLSVEDFSLKSDDGESSFPYLHSTIGNALYLPSVERPLRVLNKFADPENQNHIKLTENGLSAEIKPESGKYLFINLRDAEEGESRTDLLRRHDDFMRKTVENLKKEYDSVVALYTAHYPSWTIPETYSRTKRQAEQTGDGQELTLPSLRIIFSHVHLWNGNEESELTYSGAGDANINTTEQSNTLVFNNNNNITLNIVGRGGYWLLDSVTISNPTVGSEEIPAMTPVYAQYDWAYHCSPNVTFEPINATASYRVTFQGLRLQPYFNESGAVQEWGDSYNCIGFFTAPIWSGLFIVAVLLSITFFGIMMMMDIKTMDRFDDPKGKTITIAAVE